MSLHDTVTDVLPPGLVLETLRAFRAGDFSVRLPLDRSGIAGDIAQAVNDVIALNERLAKELERINNVVGKEGRLAQRASLGDVGGGWGACMESINGLIGDLVQPTTEVGRVIGAVASGDLSQTMTLEVEARPLRGEFLRTARVVNGMVEQLGSFASEVTRVAREVGTEGKLGGQAQVKGVAGTWKDLTDNVNLMAGNLTAQVRNIAEVTTAVAEGDLSKKITVDVKGEILQLKNTINTMVDQLNSFASEVTRVAREVGTEGKLGGQAQVKGVAGTWKDLTDNVNSMASNLTAQVRNIAEVTTAVATGDLSKKITVDVKGEILELKDTINTMVDQLNAFAGEVTRVAREVGTDGKLGGQAEVPGVGGTWKDLTDNVNSMASNLTAQVRNIAEVATAVAKGDLTKKITVDVKGEILELKNTINTMAGQLNAFASEVTRVAREVGTEGKLGGQAEVPGVGGTWKDLTDSVNFMAGNLTAQVRNIAEVTTAVAKGDLSKTITVDVKGEILQLKNTINTMVDQLNSFASEVTRVAREVGTEGKLGGQAQVKGVGGTWKDLTDSVNSMASNLTDQVRNIAEVTTAVARGDLSKKITVDVRGEILELKDTINTMVDQLNSFAAEVTRVAREVGTEGKLGGQAAVPGVGGTWKDLTDNVNFMAGNLTAQVRNIAEVTTAVARGDLSKKITVNVKGEILELKNTINTMVDQLNAFASEVTRVAREVGTEGMLGGQGFVQGVAGTWKDLTDSVNFMAGNLTAQVRNIAEVTTAVANGDLSKKITVDVKGEILELKDTINTMVDQLNAFAGEVTRVAREVGTEGKLGGQAQVRGVAGTWKDLTDNVNSMATNLTNQVRGIAKVVTAVANGDLERKLALEARGEIAELAETINSMTDTLATFADQVTSVAREVGVEGRLGGQAKVPGAAGTWRDLTDNVNQLASNLTTQVRAIGDVATAVTKGDLTRSITVEASGEVAALKDNLNEMIRNLKDTTRKTTEQDWLKTNLAKFTRMMQGQRDLVTVAQQILSELAPLVSAQHGAFYIADFAEGHTELSLTASYACKPGSAVPKLRLGEGLVGQCAFEKQKIRLRDIPDDYIRVSSSLGEASPRSITVLPVLFEGKVNAVIELASFDSTSDIHQVFLDQLTESIGIVINTIAAGMRTESLLQQSQLLTQELQSQQEELKLQQEQMQEKAEQLALTSKYKSEFLANMSHELRTPLNSLLILSKMLSENTEKNLQPKQVEFARTIHASGTDLLALINDILDLSKIESGTITVEAGDVRVGDIREYVEKNFRHVAQQKGLDFAIDMRPDLPPNIVTDTKRLQQVLKNLLANAFKFTEQGRVVLEIKRASFGWSREHRGLNTADEVVAFAVTDSGIGIPADKHRIIFEAFQQADGTTSRKFGGTGLGLSISREIARLLGGELGVVSEPGKGSTFTLYLPRHHTAPIEVVYPRPEQAPSGDGSRLLLVVSDDAAYRQELQRTAERLGWRTVTATRGTVGLQLASTLRPAGIALDIRLNDLDGWKLLDRLKHETSTRHIPVAVVAEDDERQRSLRVGGAAFLRKPFDAGEVERSLARLAALAEPGPRNLLLVEDNESEREAMLSLIGNHDVRTTAVQTGNEALAALASQRFQCMVVDVGLLGTLAPESLAHIPVVVYSGRELQPDEEAQLKRLSETVVLKDARSPERLFEETALFLHRDTATMSETQRRILADSDRAALLLDGRKILVIDDDVRNIFAITSVLEQHAAVVCFAENGRQGLEVLEKNPDIEVVLTDIMMPEMDGYEVIRCIRAADRHRDLPIIALTAKAMRDDRDKCIQAGASDYIAKPVDIDQLLSMLRVWLR